MTTHDRTIEPEAVPVTATRPPAAVRPAERRGGPLLPRSFRARLVVAFMAVVAIALTLVLATLPPLLEGYFARQENQSLETRTRLMHEVMKLHLIQQLGLDTETPFPILLGTDPPAPSPQLLQALGTPQSGRTRDFATLVAQANVEIVVSESPERPETVAYRLKILLGNRGQGDEVRREQTFTLHDGFWGTGSTAPIRLITITLTDPSLRAQTIQTIVTVMLAAGVLALVVAVLASVLLAARLTDPIRRLTRATRRLEEGDLGARVAVPEGGSPEVGELAAAFNGMAARLQETVEFTRGDRDRSRDFLADVSHELRTPIAALRTFNELLTEGAVADQATRDEFMDQSRQQIERLDWLATNLLELSKLDSGLVALDLRPDDLRGVVESAVHQAEPTAARKGIELAMELPAQPLPQRHDPPRIGQVLSNLISNAIKFTPRGGSVQVVLREVDDGAELDVIDTGVGIEAEELPSVFDRFYRGARVQEGRAAGSGLGLSIVQSIVEMHGGRVTIQSTPGRGTEVTVRLPRELTVSSPRATRV
ncbi:MAG: HAMP domain-containing histidine kinase [Chloroflexi bacterium]|nr:HAMP domain-containing histidine kinase [Chloroflexota bacterium]